MITVSPKPQEFDHVMRTFESWAITVEGVLASNRQAQHKVSTLMANRIVHLLIRWFAERVELLPASSKRRGQDRI
jgi:hypothetical protein